MVIRHIEVWNFLGHEHEAVSFEEHGIVHLSGNSGYGKSSLIVDAPAYALFGARATRTKQENLRNRNFPTEAMKVSVTFQFEDTWMTVERGLSAKGKAEAVIYEPDPNDKGRSRMVEETPKRVQKLINRRLGGMNWQQFYSAFVCRQDEIRGLIELKGTDRANRIHGMLGIHELRKGVDIIDSDLATVRAHISAQEERTAGRTQTSEEEKMRALQEESDDARVRFQRASELLDGLRQQLQQAEDALAPLSAKNKALEHAELMRKQVIDKEALLADLKERLTRHQAATEALAGAVDSRKQLEAQSKLVSELRQEATRAQTRQKLLLNKQEIIAQQEALQAPEGAVDVEGLQTQLQVALSQSKQVEEELAELLVSISNIENDDTCPTCLRGFDGEHDHQRVIETMQERRQHLQERLLELQQQSDEATAALPGARQAQEVAREYDKQVHSLAQRLTSIEEELAEITARDRDELIVLGKEAVEKERALADVVASLAAYERDLDETLPGRVQTLEVELQAARDGLDQASDTDADVEALRVATATVEDLRRRVATGEGRVPEIERNCLAAQAAVETAQQQMELLAADLKALDELYTQRQRLQDLKSYLQAFQRQLVSDIRPALEEIASEMLLQVSSGVHLAVRITSETYELEVESSDGIWLPAAELSGGEQTRVAICVRLALTHLVSTRVGVPVQFLIFDEPLPAQDAGHVEQIMELLAALGKHFKQVFIISHVGDLSSSEHVDYVLEFGRRRGASRVQLFKA